MIQYGIPVICKNCGHDHRWNIQVHHIVFVINGGKNNIENLEFLCRNCHADLHMFYGKDNE